MEGVFTQGLKKIEKVPKVTLYADLFKPNPAKAKSMRNGAVNGELVRAAVPVVLQWLELNEKRQQHASRARSRARSRNSACVGAGPRSLTEPPRQSRERQMALRLVYFPVRARDQDTRERSLQKLLMAA